MKRTFNMVEIVISLVIIMVALVGVMSLVPAGIEASSDAINRQSASYGADQFLSHMTGRIQGDWTESAPLPDVKPAGDGRDAIWGIPLYEGTNLTIRPEMPSEFHAYGPETPSTGVFLLRQTTGRADDFVAVLRVWKEIFEEGAEDDQDDEKKQKKPKKPKEPKKKDWDRG